MSIAQKILLASKSPRRKDLLTEARIPFEIIPVDVEEVYPDDMDVMDVPIYLAELKANAARPFYKSGTILAADTIVIHQGVILGKPTDSEDAKKTIQKLAGDTHTVVTGVCLLGTDKKHSFSSISQVTMHDMNDEEIDFYVREFQPFDKAGSYGIQDWIGWVKIKSIEGSYANVMGLPIDEIYHYLNRQ